MLKRGDREASRRPVYNGTAAFRLCRRRYRLVNWVAAALVAMGVPALGGCSYRMLSFGAGDDGDFSAAGAIARPAAGPARVADASRPAELDLAYARAAAKNVLALGSKDTSIPWQNPQTGAGGNITPLESSYSEDGLSCRDFLASYKHGGAQDWLQGAGCRDAHGVWQIRQLKPLGAG